MNPEKTPILASAVRPLAVTLLGCALLLGACSEESPERVPLGTTMTIAPSENVWEISDRRDAQGRCFVDESFYVDLPLLISLQDGAGVPIGDTEVDVYVNLAQNTFSGGPLLQLYDDLNSNGVVDPDTELVSGREDGIARVRTGKYGGERLLLLRTNLSCPYRSSVFAFVDGVSASSSVEVVLDCADDSPPCPLPEE